MPRRFRLKLHKNPTKKMRKKKKNSVNYYYLDMKKSWGGSQSTFYQLCCHQQPRHETDLLQPYPLSKQWSRPRKNRGKIIITIDWEWRIQERNIVEEYSETQQRGLWVFKWVAIRIKRDTKILLKNWQFGKGRSARFHQRESLRIF